ncbi:MAG: sialidase family protein [Gemmatimonadota bacterium]
MRAWIRAAVVLPFAAACSKAPAAPTTPFGAASVVSEATSNGATPMFLVTSNGTQVLSWVAMPGDTGGGALYVRSTFADGAVRTSGLRDPLGGIEPHGEAPPQMAAGPDGVLYTLYTVGKDVGGRYPASALRFARSDDGGTSWSTPVSVNEGPAFGSHSFHALIAGPDGTVYASWLNNNPAEAGVWLRVSRDGGRTWDAARAVYREPTCPCCRTALALAPDGTLYIAWRAVLSGDVRDIMVMSSKDHGTSWSTPVRPHADDWVFPGCPHAGPSLRVDAAGGVHLSWWTGKPGAAGTWYARSADGGATWRSTPIDTAITAQPAHIQLGVSGSRVLIGWDGGHAGLPGVFLTASNDGGTTFGPTWRLSPSEVAATFPVLGLGADSLSVAWTQVGDSAYRALLEAHKEPEGEHDRMALPRVGQQEIMLRRAPLTALDGTR